MENNNTEQMNKIIFNIRNMSMEEFCARVNELARATRYCTDDDNVCELLDVLNSSVKVVHFDAVYFGSDVYYMIIDDELDNDFKELFIKIILNSWDNLSQDEKMAYINNFID